MVCIVTALQASSSGTLPPNPAIKTCPLDPKFHPQTWQIRGKNVFLPDFALYTVADWLWRVSCAFWLTVWTGPFLIWKILKLFVLVQALWTVIRETWPNVIRVVCVAINLLPFEHQQKTVSAVFGGRLSWTSPWSLLHNKVLIVTASLRDVCNLCVFSLRLTAVLSSSQSTHLARSWARRTERSCTPAVAASTLTVWTCCRSARTMTRSAQLLTTTLWVNMSWLSLSAQWIHLPLSLLAVFDVLWNVREQNRRDCDHLALGPALRFF